MTDDTMMAVVTTGTGDYDRLSWQSVPRPVAGDGEVLLKVLAAGVNNTDINTRLGWYSSDVKSGTDGTVDLDAPRDDGGWNVATPFPMIQGTDCCARVEAVGKGVDETLIGRRVLVRPCVRVHGFDDMRTEWFGSDVDGAFAEYAIAPAREVFTVDCDWTDAELASVPCAWGTAENMVQRCGVREGMHVLVPGASGGVGSAVVQLAKRRGARVTGIASAAKHDRVRDFGVDRVIAREDDPLELLGAESVDVVIDNVAGEGVGTMIALLRRGGRYVSSGAIAGPIVELDMRDLYLKDITLIGSTAWDEPVFPDLIGYIERGEISPLVAHIYPLQRIAEAQRVFREKRHAGKIVLLPPG